MSNFSDCKKGALMMHCVEKWNLLFALNEKGIAVVYRVSSFSIDPRAQQSQYMRLFAKYEWLLVDDL